MPAESEKRMAECCGSQRGHVFDREDTEKLYKLIKAQLKQFEAAFEKKHGRAVRKDDIAAIKDVGERSQLIHTPSVPPVCRPRHADQASSAT